MKTKFNLLLSDEEPKLVEKVYDSSVDNVEARRTRLIGDLAVECIHAHAFLNGLNMKTGMDPRFDKVKTFVYDRFIKKTAQLFHDLNTKTTITSSVRHALDQLKGDCGHPNFNQATDRLCLDSATKYEDLLNADIVYLATNEHIKFADYANNKNMGFSTIITHEMIGEKDETVVDNIIREKVVGLCEKWMGALYGDMMTHKTSRKKGGVWTGWTTDEHRDRSWFEWACDTIGNALIALGNHVKVSKQDKTDQTSDPEQSGSRIEF